MNPQLIPKARKRKRQPTADVMREQLRLAADRIIELRLEGDYWRGKFLSANAAAFLDAVLPRPRIPWHRRLFNRIRARLVETDPETAARMPKP